MSLDILVVDDADDIGLMVAAALGVRGHQVRSAGGGLEALEILAAGPPPDLVLLDIQMPDVDGWTVLQAIRARAELAGLPVVLCTVKSSDADHARGAELGCDGYLTKPFDVGELYDLVERCAGSTADA